MIRELDEKDFIKVNELLKYFNYELNKESFDNDFLKKEYMIPLYQD